MAATQVDINPEFLEGARKAMGTKTLKETVNEALRRMAEHQQRAEQLQAYYASLSDEEVDALYEDTAQ